VTWQMRAGDRVYVFIFAFDSLRKNTKLKKDSTLQIENKTQYEISRPLNLSQRSETMYTKSSRCTSGIFMVY
jgi:hypothetical protein